MKSLNRENVGITDSYPVKVLQIGGGNFLRAFVDWMVSKMNQNGLFQGSVAVAKATPGGNYQSLRDQDGLFYVAVRGIQDGETIDRIDLVSSVEKVLHPYRDYSSLIEMAESEDLQFIVSNTTEAGIRYEAQSFREQQVPHTFPALLAAFLWKRFQVFDGDPSGGLTMLPCELIEGNGEKLKEFVLQHASDWQLSDTFRQWINQSNTFVNTLVDRIVPGYPAADAQAIFDRTGFVDQLLVAAEPYHLWVIQADKEIEPRFPLLGAGINAVYTDDLTMYRQRKVRILNGAHTSMVPVGLLAGFTTVKGFVEDDDMKQWLIQLIEGEVIPTLQYNREMLLEYKDEVLDRFRNPFVQHQLSSIALNSIAKFVTRLLPSLVTYVETEKKIPDRIVLSLAALLRWYEGVWHGKKVTLNDSQQVLEFFAESWKELRSNQINLRQLSEKILNNQNLWGMDLSTISGLAEKVTTYLEAIEQDKLGEVIKRQSSP